MLTQKNNQSHDKNVSSSNTTKRFILTKDVLKHDPLSFKKFNGNHVYILSDVLAEFSNIIESPKKNDIAIFQAKEALKKITETINGDVKEAISPDGLFLKDSNIFLHLVKIDFPKTSSNYIIEFAKKLRKDFPNDEIIVISKKLNIRVDCEFENITAQDYENDKILGEEIASLFQKVTLSDEKFGELMSDISSFNPENMGTTLSPNSYFEVNCESDKEYHHYIRYDGKNLVEVPTYFEPLAGIQPINLEQRLLFDLLNAQNVDLITVTGSGGSGKTLISVAAAIQMVLHENRYSKIIYVKPTVPTDDGQGFIKGDLYDKLRPYMNSFFDSLSVILSKSNKNSKIYKKYLCNSEETGIDVEKFAKKLIEKQLLELTCFSYMRGRNIRDSIVIVDEGQQTTPFIAKLMLSRLSENTKFLFIGDPSDNQIDSLSVDPRSNGLVYLAARLRSSIYTGHVSLKIVERGRLADLADKLL